MIFTLLVFPSFIPSLVADNLQWPVFSFFLLCLGIYRSRGRLRFPNRPSQSSPTPTLSCQPLQSKNTLYLVCSMTTSGGTSYQETQGYHVDLRSREGKRNQRIEQPVTTRPDISTWNYNHPKPRSRDTNTHNITDSNSKDKLYLLNPINSTTASPKKGGNIG